MQYCWQGLHDGIIEIDVTALMSLYLLLWSIFAMMQKVVCLIPSSLYVISCATLKWNLNSFWIVTVNLPISNTHPQFDIHSQTIPFVPLSERQKPKPGRYLQHSREWSVTPMNHRQVGYPSSAVSLPPQGTKDTVKNEKGASVKGETEVLMLPKVSFFNISQVLSQLECRIIISSRGRNFLCLGTSPLGVCFFWEQIQSWFLCSSPPAQERA